VSLPFPAFFLPAADGSLEATPLCIGPWDARFCHGGPPCALLAAAIEQAPGSADFQVARLSFDLLRPVPVGRLRVEREEERRGRTVERWRARLLAGERVVVEARGLRIRRAAVAVPPPPPVASWPAPASLERFVFPFFHVPLGYHHAVDLRLAQGQWGTTPVGFWGRPLVPLVDGQPTSALARLVVLADAQSGMGVPAPPSTHTFLNPDLHVLFERLPEGQWLGFDIRSAAGDTGMGLSQSALRDAHGAVGRSAQSLLMAAR
jgi:hypothetical protein